MFIVSKKKEEREKEENYYNDVFSKSTAYKLAPKELCGG